MMKPVHPIFVTIALAVIGSAFASHGPESHAIQAAAARPASRQSLFDGKTLERWKASDFDDNGKIEVESGTIRIGAGKPMAGITWRGEPPARTNYEIELEAMRTEGHDFSAD